MVEGTNAATGVVLSLSLALERSHQGYRLKGRTPAQALMDARRHGAPRHHPCRGGQRAAANGCLRTSPETRGVGEIRDLYINSNVSDRGIRSYL